MEVVENLVKTTLTEIEKVLTTSETAVLFIETKYQRGDKDGRDSEGCEATSIREKPKVMFVDERHLNLLGCCVSGDWYC